MRHDYFALSPKEQEFQKHQAFRGMENVPGTLRLLLMNLYLHDLDSDHVDLGDTLSDKGTGLGRANLILTNPPFGPAGGPPTRQDLSVTATVSSYQLPFVEHCIRSLEPGGRPDVNGFVGSLVGLGATKGVFVTTSSFSQPARDYVRHLAQRVILIDGQELADLMIEHDVGVRTYRTIAFKRLDEDFFSEE